MASSRDTVTAPVRVRGKRKAGPEEKWNFGKRRDPKLQKRRPNTAIYGRQPPSTTSADAAFSPATARPRKRRRRLVPQSPLEELPPEVLQTIFAYSANIMLPLTSTQLASKLCNSTHLRHNLSDRLLGPVLGCDVATRASATDLASATRLLNSRFMDFAFFKTWLRRSRDEVPVSDQSSDLADELDWKGMWLACQPSSSLLPPRKLFSAPFSQENTAFLSILAQPIDNITSLNPSYGELAYDGLSAAVSSGYAELASVLLGMGITVTTELLRAAVIDAGCDEPLVRQLLDAYRSTDDDMDLLDPIIWSWAEQARDTGDPKGIWLMEVMRESHRLRA